MVFSALVLKKLMAAQTRAMYVMHFCGPQAYIYIYKYSHISVYIQSAGSFFSFQPVKKQPKLYPRKRDFWQPYSNSYMLMLAKFGRNLRVKFRLHSKNFFFFFFLNIVFFTRWPVIRVETFPAGGCPAIPRRIDEIFRARPDFSTV